MDLSARQLGLLAAMRLRAGDAEGAMDLTDQILAAWPDDLDARRIALQAAALRAGIGTYAERYAAAVATQLARLRLQTARQALAGAQARLEEAWRETAEAEAADAGLAETATVRWQTARGLGRTAPFFSEAGQDEFLWREVFDRKRDGVFVDVGAYDGVTGSNTAFFERFCGWTGLCVEPVAEHFAALRGWRTAACVQTAVADFDGEAEFLRVAAGMTMMGGLAASYDPRARRFLDDRASTVETVTVPVRRLSGLLREHAIAAIDYLSIDTEGGEAAIIADPGLDGVPIHALSLENATATADLRDRLAARGLRFVRRLGVDDIFVAP
jgi:FkbM family methyltransferase